MWAGNKPAVSYLEARNQHVRDHPEIYGVEERNDAQYVTNRFNADFIVCLHCQNKTLRIHYAMVQAADRQEAERLIRDEGFTSISESVAMGTAIALTSARMFTFLGQADLERTAGRLQAARRQVAAMDDPDGDLFAEIIDPAVMGLMREAQDKRALLEVEERLAARFEELWTRFGEETRHFLGTAELLRRDLERYSQRRPEIDFAPAVMAYSKALERHVIEQFFEPFRHEHSESVLSLAGRDKGTERSLAVLQDFLVGKRELGLGEAAYALTNIGCAEGEPANSYAAFLQDRLVDRDDFCRRQKLPKRLLKFVMKHRNAAAHRQRLSAEECEGARAFLLEEPMQLMIELGRALR